MSVRVSGFERQAGDQYMTPEWVALTLCSVVPKPRGGIWEPAVGTRGIAKVLGNEWNRALVETDVDPTFSVPTDFLQSVLPNDNLGWAIITNPPYGKAGKLAEAFVRHALKLTLPAKGMTAMLLPIEWDAAKTRQDLFENFQGHTTKITLTERIRWTNLPQSKSGPSQNHAWFVWDHARCGRDMRWLGRVA
jgi:hypothetical protein